MSVKSEKRGMSPMKYALAVLTIALLSILAGGEARAENLSIYGVGEARPEILLVQRRVKVCVQWRGGRCVRGRYEKVTFPRQPRRNCPSLLTGQNCAR
jgi:hypothetical protein